MISLTQDEEKRLAKEYGFKCHPDNSRGEGWHKFSKNNFHVWQTRDFHWQTAIFDGDNYFKGHGKKETLREAFQNYKKSDGTTAPEKYSATIEITPIYICEACRQSEYGRTTVRRFIEADLDSVQELVAKIYQSKYFLPEGWYCNDHLNCGCAKE